MVKVLPLLRPLSVRQPVVNHFLLPGPSMHTYKKEKGQKERKKERDKFSISQCDTQDQCSPSSFLQPPLIHLSFSLWLRPSCHLFLSPPSLLYVLFAVSISLSHPEARTQKMTELLVQ